jgi:hypothetical protein
MSDTPILGKVQKDRSPSFPFIPLQTAVERLVAFEQMFGRHDTPANKAGRAWKMKDGSSQAFQTIAALKSFGLLDFRGSGPTRATFLTDEGRKYVRAQQDSIKREVVRNAALKPKAMEKFWRLWGSDRPIDDVCIDDLHFVHGFTQSAAETFLRVYDATIAYAGLSDSDNNDGEIEDDDPHEEPAPEVGVGDLVQVEINGVAALPHPVRVRAVQEHEGKPWVFVEGSESGIPVDQIQLHQKAATPAPSAPPMLPLPEAHQGRPIAKDGWKEERLIDDEGDETFLSYKGEPSIARYQFIRDYLDFRISRLKPKPQKQGE